MGFLDIFKWPEYDQIDTVHVKDNLLVMTEPNQKAIKKLSVGSPLYFDKKKRDGHNVYIARSVKNGDIIGELSYGTSDYIAEHYKGMRLFGRVNQLGKLTPMGEGIQVNVEYKIYK